MPRPLDLARRAELLDGAVTWMAEHGIAATSLRPLAAALGTSDRMLLHHFGSKENLVAAVIAGTRPDVEDLLATGTPSEVATRVWQDLTGDGPQRPRVRLALEVLVLAGTRPAVYGETAAAVVRAWVEPLARLLGSTARATALVSGLRGIALDRFATGDLERTDDAARELVAALCP